ncbi:TPA: hydantoinase/oxoprolinase family protein [Klebsiella michiganensis]|nr:hydantoinase/oxoprolinase family protein [Klebsiella michiganensis]
MRIGVDVGGTFTDVVTLDAERGLTFVKTPSVPSDPGQGVLDGLILLARELGTSTEDLLSKVTVFIHGTTVATNILVQRNGAKVGLITTRGFRDLLELREGTKQQRYNLREAFPTPLIERILRHEVDERLAFDGSVMTPLDEAQVRRVVEALRKEKVGSVVVCLMHSHKNSGHELKIRELIHQSGWQPYISLSHEVLSRQGEYDRLSTSVVNSYVGPGLSGYLSRLSDNLREKGVKSPLMIMQSNGGVLPAAEAGKMAVGAVTSGPAGGAMAGALFARHYGLPRVVAYDTGGTSSDVCVIENYHPVEIQNRHSADMKIAVPAIDINPLAIGGGSIAAIDDGGILTLGPKSAGATPGPACFMKGGRLPTLTDANLVLGYIGHDTFLGGRMELSLSAAREVIQSSLAGPLGLSVEQAALAVHSLATSKITEGIRLATVRRGSDPREFTLLSFGGAGGIHASSVAKELSIPETIIPRQASVLSALGFLAADVRQDLQVSVGKSMADLSNDEIFGLIEDLSARARTALMRQGFDTDNITLNFIAECRYARQIHSIPVFVNPEWHAQQFRSELQKGFEVAYFQLYHHVHRNESGMLEQLRVAAYGTLPPLSLPEIAVQSVTPEPVSYRRIFDGEFYACPVFRAEDMGADIHISGPAIIDSSSTTVLLHAGDMAVIDSVGCLHITRGNQDD